MLTSASKKIIMNVFNRWRAMQFIFFVRLLYSVVRHVELRTRNSCIEFTFWVLLIVGNYTQPY